MSPATLYLARLFGAYCIAASAWLYFRREAAVGLIDRISSDPVFESMIGTIRLVVGLAIVTGHNRWGGWVESLVSLIGWIALTSGVATMFLPTGAMSEVVAAIRLRENLPAYALVSLLLGVFLFAGGTIY